MSGTIIFEGKGAIDVTVVHDNVSITDQNLFLGPWGESNDPNTFLKIGGNPTWEDIAVLTGLFPSKGQARKNGWTGEIGQGFHQRAIGQNQRRRCITFLNTIVED